MEDSEEDEVDTLVKEEDEVVNHCNAIIVECWDIVRYFLEFQAQCTHCITVDHTV